MIGFVKDIAPLYENGVSAFTNLNFVDTSIPFEEARAKIDFFIPEFTKYTSGNRKRTKLYGEIRKYYIEELIYMNDNLYEEIDLKNLDNFIETSCALYKDLRIVVLGDNISMPNITGFDIISFTRSDTVIHTLFMQDEKVNVKTSINMCLKLFDEIIVTSLYKHNIPITGNKFVSLIKDGTNGFKVSKFIYDYFYELLYPFAKKMVLDEKDLNYLICLLSKYNFEILSEEELLELYNHIKDSYATEYNYYDLIMKHQCQLEGKNRLFSTD
jgi:hypothetical protein